MSLLCGHEKVNIVTDFDVTDFKRDVFGVKYGSIFAILSSSCP